MKRTPFSRMLIANRGEIAIRLIRAARESGIESVAVYSDADAGAPHVLEADLAVRIGPPPAVESYLRIDAIIEAARQSGAQAIHPGYGFLAENPLLAEACEAAGLVFVGPPAEAMRRMGDKAEARALAQSAGVPVVPGYNGESQDDQVLLAEARRIGFPLLIKPAAGGGGKGMRLVTEAAHVADALAGSRREAKGAFGDDRLLLERFLAPVRHVEIQVFADSHGNAVHLLERECSIQRRHQKIVEESPSPGIRPETREAMGRAAVSLALAAGYRSAGTVEFVLSPDQSFHFLEMNTRLQVEHPVTEMVTGLDLARMQIREAMGEPITLRQEEVRGRGHAIECRLYAEDPAAGFLPSSGEVLLLREPQGPGVRVDSGIVQGWTVGVHYDPILSKIIVHAPDRTAAIARMRRALAETVLLGFPTNVEFLQAVLQHPAFAEGETPTDFIERHLKDWAPSDAPPGPEVLAFAAMAEALTTPGMRLSRNGNAAGRGGSGAAGTAGGATGAAEAAASSASAEGDLYSPWALPSGFRIGNLEEARP